MEFTFKNHDEARRYFLALQNLIKNMNFVPIDHEEYKKIEEKIESMLTEVALVETAS